MAKSQFASKCKKCDRNWDTGTEIFMSKSPDGNSWITCTDKECFESQGGKVSEGKKPFSSSKFPITESEAIWNKAEALLDSFKKKRQDVKLTAEQELVFMESVFRTLSGNFKP